MNYQTESFATIEKRLNQTRRKLTRIGDSIDRAISLLRGGNGNGTITTAPTELVRVSKTLAVAKPKAQRILQGRYMGYMRGLKVSEKKKVRAMREKKGFVAAIKLAKSYHANANE